MDIAQCVLLMVALCAAFFQVMSVLEFHALLVNHGKAHIGAGWLLSQLVCLFAYYLLIVALVGVK